MTGCVDSAPSVSGQSGRVLSYAWPLCVAIVGSGSALSK
jgi:hypothetical protein